MLVVKLLSWPPKTPFLYFSRFLNHAVCEDPCDDDPPFSLSPKPTKPHEPKPNKTRRKPSKPDRDPKSLVKSKSSHLPFDFRYSYSESDPAIDPTGYREPKRFSPFGPGRLDRIWTGTSAPAPMEVELEKLREERGRVLGDPLTEEEVGELVERYRHSDCSRQINLGKCYFSFPAL
uniref:Uncharacterized protein n=1 Tax=Rhizophora mucronata TaxID=61149 RepID=A0A2P2MY33_RHIMU